MVSHPATINKVLIHAKQILENSVLPAGYFGEEASEARNKFYKRDREFHARKNSRINNLEDIFNRAMDTSDPVISSISLQYRLKRWHKLTLPSVIAMLSPPQVLIASPTSAINLVASSEDDMKTILIKKMNLFCFFSLLGLMAKIKCSTVRQIQY